MRRILLRYLGESACRLRCNQVNGFYELTVFYMQFKLFYRQTALTGNLDVNQERTSCLRYFYCLIESSWQIVGLGYCYSFYAHTARNHCEVLIFNKDA